jgi:hypothetical protein
MAITEIIAILSIASAWVPLCVYLFKTKRMPSYIHIFGAVLIVNAFSDIGGFILAKYSIYTYSLYNTYDVIQFLLLSWFYYHIIFKEERKLSVQTIFILIPFSVIYLLSLLLISSFEQNFFTSYQNAMWTTSAAILIIYGIAYFNNLFSAVGKRRTLKLSLLTWLNSGLLYFFSFGMLLFVTREYLMTQVSADVWALFWSFNNINNIIKNTLFTIGFAFYADNTEV